MEETGRWRDLSNVRAPSEIQDAYVVVHPRYLFADLLGNPLPPQTVPEFLTDPPKSWTRLVSQQGTPAYNSVTLYYVPPTPVQAADFR